MEKSPSERINQKKFRDNLIFHNREPIHISFCIVKNHLLLCFVALAIWIHVGQVILTVRTTFYSAMPLFLGI